MRAILALAILLLEISSAAPEPEYSSSRIFNSFQLVEGNPSTSLVEIESSIGKGDRLVIAMLPSSAQSAELQLTAATQITNLASNNSEPASDQPSPPGDPATATPISLGALCNALFSSAQDNHLPVTFFANLLWQESGLQKDIVSRKGAMGIAQFMPQTAIEKGLGDPFDPLQSISASARFLRELRGQFGNLGFVAAAYNAGPRRVSEWLERHRRLPRETQSYVVNVTGRSVEEWQKTPPGDAALRFVQRLPCRDMSAFAELERAQAQQPDEQPKAPDEINQTAQKHNPRNLLHREAIRATGETHSSDKHEAKEHGRRALRERHGRV
jgi:soluble lytic murein transglycosylase-like protein